MTHSRRTEAAQFRLGLSAHEETPYADALKAHAASAPLMFMVPGHAASPDGFTEGLTDLVGARAVEMDIPQLVDGIDVGSESPLVQAERLAADAWGARRTWFLANGSSQGNRMAILAVAGLHPGDRDAQAPAPQTAHVIAQRSAHSSLTDGLILSGLSPIFLEPSIDRRLGIHHGLTPELLEAALTKAAAESRAVAAAQVVSPSYFGAVSDIRGLTEVAHRHGVPIIVDAAWGAHFGFHDLLPQSPSRLGADLVISSTHKMGGSLGQAAMLHLGDGPFADALEPLIDRAFRLTQTTSASSLLLGSLDVARSALVTHSDLLSESVRLADELRDWVREHQTFALVSDGFSAFPDIAERDPLRVAIDVTGLSTPGHTVTGYDVRSKLVHTDNIYLEIATSGAVVAFFGPGKSLDISRLSAALDRIAREPAGHGEDHAGQTFPRTAVSEPSELSSLPPLPDPGEARCSPREAYFAATEIVPAEEAVGRVSADALAAYPPGIPNVVPGEVITPELVAFLRAVASSPIGYVRGSLDPHITEFRVLRD